MKSIWQGNKSRIRNNSNRKFSVVFGRRGKGWRKIYRMHASRGKWTMWEGQSEFWHNYNCIIIWSYNIWGQPKCLKMGSGGGGRVPRGVGRVPRGVFGQNRVPRGVGPAGGFQRLNATLVINHLLRWYLIGFGCWVTIRYRFVILASRSRDSIVNRHAHWWKHELCLCAIGFYIKFRCH